MKCNINLRVCVFLKNYFILVLLICISESQSSSISSEYASYNSACNKTFRCNPEGLLICTTGKCECESPSNQKFNREMKICQSSVGGHCNTGLIDPNRGGIAIAEIRRNCIKNARCVEIFTNDFVYYTECQCDNGYIENSAGECVPGIGMPCNYGPNECNPMGMVVCKNERCACLDKLQVYDQEIRRCVSPAGTHCKYDTVQLGCVKNAICYPFYYWVPPRCVCKPGYAQTISRTCVPEHLQVTKELVEDL